MRQTIVGRGILVLFLGVLWVYLRTVYRDRLGAFGCFDDCFNIAGGYFLTLGKRLYTDFFFNHQSLLAYISWVIQTVYQPQSIYELVYRHRMTLIYYFFLADVFLRFVLGSRSLPLQSYMKRRKGTSSVSGFSRNP